MSVTINTKNIRLGISDKETILLATLANNRKTFFELKDVPPILKISYQYAKVVVDRLRKKKWLIQVSKGKYLISPLSAGMSAEFTEHEFVIASKIIENKPYYIAYWSALNYYGYTEQTPFTVFVATTNRIHHTTIHDVKYNFVKINERKFFGIKPIFVNNNKIFISDKMKTIVDALDHPEYCGGIEEVAKCLWNAKNDLDFKTLIEYSKKMNNSTIIKRLGYLVDVLELSVSENIYATMQQMIGKGRSWLDVTLPKQGKSNLKWNLFLNTQTEDILEAKSLM